ncbi:MAG TPA: late competence development ComFB family protein [Firmicutes bacterium]|nr:late competence development ComFB family protein [Bacillota bacterium]
MELRNYMEDVVKQVFEEYLERDPDFCRCERCRRDTIVLTLNQLRGKYVGSQEGEIRAAVEAADRQAKADAMLALVAAARQVKAHPHHPTPPPQEEW